MLYILGIILLACWGLGLAFKITAGLFHLVLLAAVVLFVVGFFQGRGAGTKTI